MLKADRLGHRVSLLPSDDPVFVKPNFLRRLAFNKEQEIRTDGSVGLKDAVGQTDNRMEITLIQQMFLEPRLDAFAEQRAVGKNHGGATTGSKQPDDKSEKQ